MSAPPQRPPASPADLPAVAGGTLAKSVAYSREKRYGDDELRELREALDQGSLFFAHGSKVKSLERAYAARAGCSHGIATSSGTATIHAALMAVGVSPGDDVIVPPITDMGSVVPILWQGAIPVFADLDPDTYNLDPASVERAMTDRTRAILAVHLAGNACDVVALQQVAASRGAALVEDCAQAHGTMYRGRPVGSFGTAGCFSFNEFKHISCGDGGVLVTSDDAIAARARLAIDKAYNRDATALVRSPTLLANNYRMTELQGAVARAQLRKLDSIVERRRAWCRALSSRIAHLPELSVPTVTPGCEESWWFYMLRVRPAELSVGVDEVTAALRAEGLPVYAHYIGQPVYAYPLFANHSAFAHAGHAFASRRYERGLCPNAEAILDTAIVLSVNEAYSQLDLDETVRGFEKVLNWFSRSRRDTGN